MKPFHLKFALTLLLVASATGTQAALVARSLDANASTTEAFYDTALNVTWLADANLAVSQNFGVALDPVADIPGVMSRNAADSFVAGMNGTSYLGQSNWRLPDYLVRDELGSLLTTLSSYDANPATFAPLSNLTLIPTKDIGFWSADPIDTSGNLSDYPVAWRMSFSGAGANAVDPDAFPNRVLPVLSGDVGVAVTAVPEPSAAALLGMGLALLGFSAGRRRGR